jgi:hypothetical protein
MNKENNTESAENDKRIKLEELMNRLNQEGEGIKPTAKEDKILLEHASFAHRFSDYNVNVKDAIPNYLKIQDKK